MYPIGRRTFLKLCGALSASALLPTGSVSGAEPEASLILLNGRVATVDSSDSVSEALAVRGDKVLAVGSSPHIKSFRGHGTTVFDLQGKCVTPGLIDSHAHLPPFGSRELHWVKLQGVPSRQKILELIAARTEKTPAGTFINAWGIESSELTYLNRQLLDGVTTKHPVLAVHTTGQWGFANSLALQLAGIGQATASPPGSLVEKGADGQPTGLLVHYPALYLVRKAMPAPSDNLMKKSIRHAAELYIREGVTAIHDNFFMVTGMSSVDSSRLYFDLAASGQLPVRLKIWPYLPTLADTHDAVRELFSASRANPSSPFSSLGEMRRTDPAAFARVWGGLKIAIDGSGPTGGWSRNPHALMLHSDSEIREMVEAIHTAGQQISVHAVGDQAVDTMLDAFEAAQKNHPRAGPRHRIEHAMLPSASAFRRIRRAGVVISTHPQFIYAWGERWGGMRKHEFIPLRSFLDHEVPVALGADPPAFPLWQPQYALWQAVSRVTNRGTPFAAAESITIRQALRMQTMGSAYAGFQENSVGSLEKGKLADMVVWDRDLLKVAPEQIRDAQALMTIVGGKIVFSRESAETPAAAPRG